MDVDRVLKEVMRSGPKRKEGQAVLALLIPHYVGMVSGLASIRRLREAGVPIFLWSEGDLATSPLKSRLSEATGCGWTPCLPTQGDDLAPYGALYLPVLTPGLAWGLAAGYDRDPVVRAVLLALFGGVSIGALTVAVDPSHHEWKAAGLAAAAARLPLDWGERLRRLRSYGFRLFRTEADVVSWALRTGPGPSLVDEKTVLACQGRGDRVIDVGPATAVTPLAWDRAREAGIEIRRADHADWQGHRNGRCDA